MAVRREVFGGAELWLGDCREIAPTLPRPAALIGDPPYGQRQKCNLVFAGGTRHSRRWLPQRGWCAVNANVWPDQLEGDDAPFNPAPWLPAADIVVLWGAHKFADRLPPGQFLIWDKSPLGKVRDQGCGEAAWVNADRPMRIYRLLWDGFCVGAAARSEVTKGQKREHPTQKPVALMRWCIKQARVPVGGLILDPWMGAGSTLIAAVELGHPCTGIEIESRYFDAACRRVEAAVAKLDPVVALPN